MFLVDLVSWWYFKGWNAYFGDFKRRLSDTVDLFSFGEMFRTLFKPFRQISANASGEAIDSKISAFFDRLVSRFVGFFARLAIILAGMVVLIFEVVFGAVIGILWPVVPLMPIAGIVLFVVGVKL